MKKVIESVVALEDVSASIGGQPIDPNLAMGMALGAAAAKANMNLPSGAKPFAVKVMAEIEG